MKHLEFTRLKNLPMLFLGCGLVVEAIALIIYFATGVNEFNETLSTPVIAFGFVTIGLGLALLCLRVFALDESRFLMGLFDMGILIDYLFALLAFMFYVTTQVNYLANVMVAIDGTTISASFIFTFLFYLIGFVLILISGITSKKLYQVAEKENNEHESKTA